MNRLLEITGNDIEQLRDDDLRSLIGQLCEADYRSAGLPTKGITWGGNQDAQDGGLDVIVRDEVEPPASGPVPRKYTGFQVKKPDMPRQKILEEMRPKGVLRDSIKELIQAGGAYLIVSSKASTTEKALANRIKAMRDAVADVDTDRCLHVDFLDQGRVATWVRDHPALILWVRYKIGRSLQGWKPYENWANAPGGIEEEYLLDDGLRLHDGTSANKGSGGPSAGRYVSMKPGITGLWQVSKRSDTENYQERIELDDWYVLNHSLTGDLKIILKTVGCMISGKGAC